MFEAKIVEGGAALSILANRSRFTLRIISVFTLLDFANCFKGRLLLPRSNGGFTTV